MRFQPLFLIQMGDDDYPDDGSFSGPTWDEEFFNSEDFNFAEEFSDWNMEFSEFEFGELPSEEALVFPEFEVTPSEEPAIEFDPSIEFQNLETFDPVVAISSDSESDPVVAISSEQETLVIETLKDELNYQDTEFGANFDEVVAQHSANIQPLTAEQEAVAYEKLDELHQAGEEMSLHKFLTGLTNVMTIAMPHLAPAVGAVAGFIDAVAGDEGKNPLVGAAEGFLAGTVAGRLNIIANNPIINVGITDAIRSTFAGQNSDQVHDSLVGGLAKGAFETETFSGTINSLKTGDENVDSGIEKGIKTGIISFVTTGRIDFAGMLQSSLGVTAEKWVGSTEIGRQAIDAAHEFFDDNPNIRLAALTGLAAVQFNKNPLGATNRLGEAAADQYLKDFKAAENYRRAQEYIKPSGESDDGGWE